MKRTCGAVVIGLLMATAGSAWAYPPPDWEPPGDDDGGGGDDGEDPPPTPPPPQSLLFSASKSGSIGGSAVGANYQGSLQAWTDAARHNVHVRGYASGYATLLGHSANLAIINAYAKGGDVFGTEISVYVLGSQVFGYNDSFPGNFLKQFTAIDYRANLWQWERDWTWAGTGARVRLAIDGGFTLNGTVYGGWLYAGGGLEPHAWADVGGSLSAHLIGINVGSISGMIHLFDATASGNLNIDISALIFGEAGSYSISGWARLCSGGGFFRGCVAGICGDIARWNNYCPDWLALSGQTGGSISP